MSERFELYGNDVWDNRSKCYVGEGANVEHLRILNAHDDLVAALKELRRMYFDAIDDLSDLQKDTIEFVDRAIAKAEGQ